MFFFEKKNQKTFGLWCVGSGERTHQRPRVFCFFSSERKTFLCLPGEFMPNPISLAAVALLACLCWTAQAAAQRATPDDAQDQGAAPPKKTPAAKPRGTDNPFASALVPWFSLTPEGSSLIRAAPQGGYDLTAREDQTYITVFGKKKPVDPRSDREHDYSSPAWSDIGLPKDIPIGPPGSCSGGAYRTIGGQPATGADLMGGLGGGRC
jgi:hypothetical protein